MDELLQKKDVRFMWHFVCSIPYFVFMLLSLTASGCAIHYFDAESGTEHIWGVGHIAMKPAAPRAGLKAVGQRTDVVGISVGRLQEGMHFEVGWVGHQRIEIVDENTQLCLAWPHGSFYTARIGSAFPPELDDCVSMLKEKLP
jgi:hypothetical protein